MRSAKHLVGDLTMCNTHIFQWMLKHLAAAVLNHGKRVADGVAGAHLMSAKAG